MTGFWTNWWWCQVFGPFSKSLKFLSPPPSTSNSPTRHGIFAISGSFDSAEPNEHSGGVRADCDRVVEEISAQHVGGDRNSSLKAILPVRHLGLLLGLQLAVSQPTGRSEPYERTRVRIGLQTTRVPPAAPQG